ncbi:pentapeptide repeat-containing protein [Capilliphycus salinus ALCB114379]|uniref:pentapeptide repeat-containing protein n=1 Tax=Capilliphycus salinus TaxID=2768948 RepID=UPI0039A424B9
MKGNQVSQLYSQGRRDFRGQNLRSQSFQGQNLSGADFSYADIQGTNFQGATLREVKFRGAKAGVPKAWVVILSGAAWLFSVLLGLALVLVGYFVLLFLNMSTPEDANTGWTALALMLVLVFIGGRRGIERGWGAFIDTIEIALVGIIIGVISGLGNAISLLGTLAIAGVLAGFGGAILFASAVAFGVIFSLTERLAWVMSLTKVLTVAVLASAIAGYISGGVSAIAIAISVFVTFWFDYIGWRGILGDKNYMLIHNLSVNLAATGGTSFRQADLTDANFTNAHLKGSDFRQAKLIRTRWRGAKQLDQLRGGNTYLDYPQIRELLQTGQGKNQNFDFQDLRELSLQNANLTGASFVGANLSSTNLRGANLSKAKLIQTKLSQANLNGATLTGAYIQDWGITLTTQLRNITCDYLFLRLPSEKSSDPNPYRQPSDWNRTLNPQEFTAIIRAFLENRQSWYSSVLDLNKNGSESFGKISQVSLKGEAEYEEIEKIKHSLNQPLESVNPSPASPSNLIPNETSSEPILTETVNPPENAQPLPENLAAIVSVIEQFIEEIEADFPLDTTSKQMKAAAEIMEQLESDPVLKQSLIEILTVEKAQKIERAINRPVGFFIVKAIQSWGKSNTGL